jgi:hypothetical protein
MHIRSSLLEIKIAKSEKERAKEKIKNNIKFILWGAFQKILFLQPFITIFSPRTNNIDA